MRVACSLPGWYRGTRASAERLRRDHATYTGASKPGTSRLYELTHWAERDASSPAWANCPATNAPPTAERPYGSSSSVNAFAPSLERDRWVCIPEPFSSPSGLGMKVACHPYRAAYSLTVIR